MDYYIDTNFNELWNVDSGQDHVCVKCRNHICVKFRTEFLIMHVGYSLTALSTMEVECIALSQSMQHSIPLQEICRELQTFVISGKSDPVAFFAHTKVFTLDHIP